ncbi:MAG: glycosyltransferase [Parcubacteria group bacterium Gr01-1014_66]|nr:MAG: glycosyltransferase [Parcubacteria group bacterium Gr01-1014_66]
MLSLARRLQERGHAIKIYAFAYSRTDSYEDLLEGLEVIPYPFPIKSPITYYPNYIASITREAKEAKAFAAIMDPDFDVLNPHDQVSYKVAHYYKRLHRNIPSVWNMNDVPSLRWGYDKMREVTDSFHQPMFKRILYAIFDWYDNVKFIRTQDAIVVLDYLNRRLVKKYLGREAIIVRNGPDLEHFSYRTRMAPTKSHVQLLTSGILMPHRRFQDAIRAVKILQDRGIGATLTIIGDYKNDPAYYKQLLQVVKELQVEDKISFRGRVSEAELIEAYHGHDIYIWQHHLQSGGLSPFEAAACGMPIVVSKSSGCSEVLTDHKNALLIEPKRPELIASAVRELVESVGLYEKMSKEGSDFVRANFSWDRYTDTMLNILHEMHSKSKYVKNDT